MLKNLQLIDENLKKFPSNIQKLTHLELLELSYNKISDIPCDIKNLLKLKTLKLVENNLTIIPPEIGYLTSLTYINMTFNHIKCIPSEIGNLTNLDCLSLSFNEISEMPLEFENLTNLKCLALSCNKLKDVNIKNLTSLEILDLVENKITNIPNEIEKLIKLKDFYISSNKLSTIPSNIINCKDLKTFIYMNNEINYIPPQVIRFLNRLYNISLKNLSIYEDKQNIHDSSIQKCIHDSIIKITNLKLNGKYDDIIYDIINDNILSKKCKELIIEYASDEEYHSICFITFKELLCHIWVIINNDNKNKDEIKKILNTEMMDAECKCFTGRLTRLVNTLNGFTDLVDIKISDSQQIASIIIMIRDYLITNNQYSIERHKELSKNELMLREYDEDIIAKWLEHIDIDTN
jgi:hypothetical protein